MIYFGTSGFSYEDWVGNFYPAGMPKREWLTYYSNQFSACEINATYYAVPGQASARAMVEKTGKDFLFSVKANQKMTHQRDNNAEVFEAFCRMLEPFVEAGKLGCVLAQFPYSFRPDLSGLDYLGVLRERLGGLPVVVEFRNAGWLKEEVFGLLRRLNLGFCCVDEPRLPNLLPPLAKVTSDIGYARFHGRNSARWWQHEHAYERYNYSYSPEELGEWLPKIQEMDGAAEKTFVFANNHWRGQSVNTIRQLRMMLD
jgi:uncharacterized protein YecE (DUF72 family)